MLLSQKCFTSQAFKANHNQLRLSPLLSRVPVDFETFLLTGDRQNELNLNDPIPIFKINGSTKYNGSKRS